MSGASSAQSEAMTRIEDNPRTLLSMMAAADPLPSSGHWVKAVICITTNQILFMEAGPWFLQYVLETIFLWTPDDTHKCSIEVSDGVPPLVDRLALHTVAAEELRRSMSRLPVQVLTDRGRELRKHVLAAQPDVEWKLAVMRGRMFEYACPNFNTEPGAGCPWHSTKPGSWCPGCGTPMGKWVSRPHSVRVWHPAAEFQQVQEELEEQARPSPFKPEYEEDREGAFFHEGSTFFVTDDLNFCFSANKRHKENVIGKLLRARGIRDARELRVQNMPMGLNRMEKDAVLSNSRNVLSRALDLVQNVNDFFSGSVMFER